MGVMEKVGETITTTSKDVATKYKFAGDINKIKRQITYEEEKINDFYLQLGKRYYIQNSAKPNDEEYGRLCNEIEVCSARIERLKQEIYVMKGIKVCKNCGAAVNDNFLFCGVCGSKLPDPVHSPENVAPASTNGTFAFSQK